MRRCLDQGCAILGEFREIPDDSPDGRAWTSGAAFSTVAVAALRDGNYGLVDELLDNLMDEYGRRDTIPTLLNHVGRPLPGSEPEPKAVRNLLARGEDLLEEARREPDDDQREEAINRISASLVNAYARFGLIERAEQHLETINSGPNLPDRESFRSLARAAQWPRPAWPTRPRAHQRLGAGDRRLQKPTRPSITIAPTPPSTSEGGSGTIWPRISPSGKPVVVMLM